MIPKNFTALAKAFNKRYKILNSLEKNEINQARIEELIKCIDEIANVCSWSNENFNYQKFFKACTAL